MLNSALLVNPYGLPWDYLQWSLQFWFSNYSDQSTEIFCISSSRKKYPTIYFFCSETSLWGSSWQTAITWVFSYDGVMVEKEDMLETGKVSWSSNPDNHNEAFKGGCSTLRNSFSVPMQHTWDKDRGNYYLSLSQICKTSFQKYSL